MSLKNLKDSELNKLLDEVALDLNKAFGEVQTKLAKKEDVAKEEVQKDEDAPPAKDEGSEEPVSEGSDSAPPSAPADDGGSPPAPGADAGGAPDPAMEQGAALTPEALQAEYEKLPPEELQMHMAACQAALAKLSGGMGADPMAGGAGAPPPPEAAAAPPAAPGAGAPPPQQPLMQSEKKAEGDKLAKSEEKLSKAEAEVASLKEDVEILAKTLKQLIETPVRKAITSITDLPKEEAAQDDEYKSLAPTDFWAKLAEVAKRPDLKKSEKKLILDIYAKTVQPEVAAKQLARLFKAE